MNSLLQFLNTFSNLLQTTLFPVLDQELGPLTGQHRALVEALALLQMDGFVEARRRRGRSPRTAAPTFCARLWPRRSWVCHTLSRAAGSTCKAGCCVAAGSAAGRVLPVCLMRPYFPALSPSSPPQKYPSWRPCGADPAPLCGSGCWAHQPRFHRDRCSRKGSVEAKNKTPASLTEQEQDSGTDDPDRASVFA